MENAVRQNIRGHGTNETKKITDIRYPTSMVNWLNITSLQNLILYLHFQSTPLTFSLPSTSKIQYLSAKHVSRTPEY